MSGAGESMGEVPDTARPVTADLQPEVQIDQNFGAMPRVLTPEYSPANTAEPTAPSLTRMNAGPVSLVDLCDGRDAETADAKRLRENLERRAGDEQLRQALALANFTGRPYKAFEDELARYGISVMRGWLYSGRIFELVAARGYRLAPTEHELEKLQQDSDEREELTLITVAGALPRFKQHALVEEGWNQEGGASIATYFMGACLPIFPNEFRRWRVAEARWRRSHRVEARNLPPDVPDVGNPATQVAGLERVRDALTRASSREQRIIALTIDGYSQEEIVEILEETSVRAVEGVLHRWRPKLRPYLSEGGEQW